MDAHEKIQMDLLAAQIRLQSIISMGSYGSGHAGGVLSLADLMAVLYGRVMHYNPKDPAMDDRDRLVLSKGHCGPVLYAALALEGFFPLDMLKTLNANGTRLPSHCNMHETPGVDMSTGSLGQGASLAVGIALGMKLRKIPRYTYLVLGDGECDEGQVWEAAMLAPQFKLDNLIAFVDWNHQQLDGYTDSIVELGDLEQKFRDFGWNAKTVPGHEVEAIHEAILSAQSRKNRPSMIILDTVKGKGWTQTEGKPNVHHVTISPEQSAQAEEEIGGIIRNLEAQLKSGEA